MGILLTKNTKPILIQGTDIELNSVYIRVSVNCSFDGKTISVSSKTFVDYLLYLQDKNIITNINHLNYDFAILETETHSIETALIYMQNKFIELGFNAEIV